jgi:hypothetical protein
VIYVRNAAESLNFVVNVLHEQEGFNHNLRTEAWLNEMKVNLTALGVI